MDINYVGKLQEIMAKEGITPIYKIVSEKISATRAKTFKMRLTCPLVPGGENIIVHGNGLSKKAAKHEAASIFLKKYSNEFKNNNDDDTNASTQVQKQIVCTININSLNKENLLQIICTKNDFEKPEYFNVLQAGPSHSPNFIVACKVGDLRTEGEGPKKATAKLNATTRMIQSIMQEQQIYEIFESAELEISDNNNNGDIVCLSNNVTAPRIPNKIGIYGRKLRSVSLKESPQLKMQIKSEVRKNDQNTSDSVCRVLSNGFETEGVICKERIKPLNKFWDCVDKGASTSSSLKKKTPKMRAHLEIINKIDIALENVENQLYEKIRDTLEPRSLNVKRNVTILHNEFDVIINRGKHAEITNGCSMCTDKSIRIACLSKLLMELKENILNNC